MYFSKRMLRLELASRRSAGIGGKSEEEIYGCSKLVSDRRGFRGQGLDGGRGLAE